MPIFDMNFTDRYCRHWTVANAVREIVANAEDERRIGGTMSVEHKGEKLIVTSHGRHLTTRALAFGATTKEGDDRTIGKFGDGLKAALAVFLRYEMAVRIDTGREIWTPRYIQRDGLDRVVAINVRAQPAKYHRERVVFEVEGVTVSDWAEWQKMFLFLSPPVDRVETESGSLLRDEALRGAIYCRGIFVERKPDYRYGYDLNDLQLNRDRAVADSWEVDQAIRRVWDAAAKSFTPARVDLIALLTNHDQRELSISSYSAPTLSPETRDSVVAAFVSAHGADAVPVSSSDEAARAGQNGVNGVIVPNAMRTILAVGGVKSLADVIAARRESVEKTYSMEEIEPREVDAIQSAIAIFSSAVEGRGESMPTIEIVDFADPSRLGLFVPDSERVLIARKLLAGPRRKLYGIVAHEIAHRAGGDGDAAHREAIEDLMGRAIEALVS